MDQVHPRVGGETRHGRRLQQASPEVHPRVGGETEGARTAVRWWPGPSPRGRGNRRDWRRRRERSGSIPAWAGKPHRPRFPRAARPVPMRGPSPRGRGNPAIGPTTSVSVYGSIPAWAGKPAGSQVHRSGNPCMRGPSPRGRGNPAIAVPTAGWHGLIRSIPAWAGKPPAPVVGHARWAGKPPTSPAAVKGPSPRGRGNPGSTSPWHTAVHPRVGGETSRLPITGTPYVRWVHPRVGGET